MGNKQGIWSPALGKLERAFVCLPHGLWTTCQIFIRCVWHFGWGLPGQYIIICPCSTAVILPPGLVPQSAITERNFLDQPSILHPPPHSLHPASSLLSWIVGKLLAFLCPPCVEGIKGGGCHTDICPGDMVRMHPCDMDISSLHIHSNSCIRFFMQHPSCLGHINTFKSPGSVSNC